MSPPPPGSAPRRPPAISMEELSEEPRSGSWQIPVSMGDLKKVRRETEIELKEFRQEAKTELKKELSRNEALTALAVLLGCLGTLMGGYFVVIREARAAADSGVSEVARQAKATQAELERFQREAALRLERSESASNRTEVKVDALLERFRVPNPAPMPPSEAPPPPKPEAKRK